MRGELEKQVYTGSMSSVAKTSKEAEQELTREEESREGFVF